MLPPPWELCLVKFTSLPEQDLLRLLIHARFLQVFQAGIRVVLQGTREFMCQQHTHTSGVTPVTIQHMHIKPTPPWPPKVMVMNDWLTSLLFHVNRPSGSWDMYIIKLILKIKDQDNGCGWRARRQSQPRISLIYLLFIPHQSSNHFLRYSFQTLKNPRSKSWVISKVRVTSLAQHSQSDQPFLRYYH